MNFGWTFSSPSSVHSFGAFGSSPAAMPPTAAVPTATAPAAAALIAPRRLTLTIIKPSIGRTLWIIGSLLRPLLVHPLDLDAFERYAGLEPIRLDPKRDDK